MVSMCLLATNKKYRHWRLISLGSGAFGDVYVSLRVPRKQHQAYFEPSNAKLVGQKIIKYDPEKDPLGALMEACIHYQCQHPYIVEYYGYDNISRSEDCITMEYCPLGTLWDLLKKARLIHTTLKVPVERIIPEEYIQIFVKQQLLALQHCNSQGVVQHDFKPNNVLIDTHGNTKLCDFGLAQTLNDQGKVTECYGTRLYAAPEVLRGEAHDGNVDVWALGITAIEFATLCHPYHSNRNAPLCKVRKAICEGPAPTLPSHNKRSPELNDFVKRACQQDHSKRPDALSLLNHPFVTKPSTVDSLLPLILALDAIILDIRAAELQEGNASPSKSSSTHRTILSTPVDTPPNSSRSFDGEWSSRAPPSVPQNSTASLSYSSTSSSLLEET